MKIAHISQRYYDGLGYDENLLPRYQKKLGHDVVLITSTKGMSVKGNSIKIIKKAESEYQDNGVRIIRIPILGEFKRRFVLFKDLESVLIREKPDYIYHHGITHPSIFAVVKYKKRHPSVFVALDCHDDLNNSARKYLWRLSYYNLFWANALKNNIKYIDLVFGVTPARCYFANEELGIPWSFIRLLPIGADEELGAEVLRSIKKKENYDNRLIIVTGGKITKEKNIAALLRGIVGLDVNLRIFGTFSEELKCQMNDYIKRGIKLELYGWQNRKRTLELLAGSDIAVWNRQHTTLIEDSISVLTPLILRYHGSTSHLLRGNGVYLYSDNPFEIMQWISFFNENRKILEEMKNSSKKMLDILSYNNIAKESIDYYYDKTPKMVHNLFMKSPLCNPNNPEFRKLDKLKIKKTVE